MVSFKTAPGVHLGGGKVVASNKPKVVSPPKNMTKGTVSRPKTYKDETSEEPLSAETSGVGRPGDYAGAGGGSALGNVLADIKTIYKTELRSRIEENKFYPMLARRMGQTGTVVVAFTLLKDGSITDLKIADSSGNPGLDTAALEAVKKVRKFKEIPSELKEVSMDLSVPIKFN